MSILNKLYEIFGGSKILTWLIIILAVYLIIGCVVNLVEKINQKKKPIQNVGSGNGTANISSNSHIDACVLGYFNGETDSGCFSKKPKYYDSDYDNVVLTKVNEFASTQKALEIIGVDESQVSEVTPVCFKGFECEGEYMSRYGLDGKFRTSQYSISRIFFSNSQIYVFKVFFDFLKRKTDILTCEYFYKDITNFSYKSSVLEYDEYTEKKGCLSKGYEPTPKKNTTKRFCITVPGDEFQCSVSGVSELEKTIQGMKQKLREKKENC